MRTQLSLSLIRASLPPVNNGTYSNVFLDFFIRLLRFCQVFSTLPCRVLPVVLHQVTCACPGAQFRVPRVVEHGYISQDLELLDHVPPVIVQLVDVLDQPGHVVRHCSKLRPWKFIGAVHQDLSYHSVVSRCFNRRSLHSWAFCSQRSQAAAALSCAFVRAVVLWPSKLTSSLGFLLSGVLVNDIGVLWRGTLASPPERVDIALPLDVSVSSAKNMFLVKDGGRACKGSFLFSALNRLKVGVGEGGDEFLV